VTTASGPEELTIGVVARSDASATIEVVEEGEPRRVSERKLLADGRIEAARFQEISAKGRSAVVPQELLPAEGDGPAPDGERTAKDAPLEILGKTRIATVEKIVFRDEALGRAWTDENVWCRELPCLYDGADAGGLVRRSRPRDHLTVELLSAGDGYRALLAADVQPLR
jgi:hypothetical protein